MGRLDWPRNTLLGDGICIRERYSGIQFHPRHLVSIVRHLVHFRHGQCAMDFPQLGSTIHQLEEDIADAIQLVYDSW